MFSIPVIARALASSRGVSQRALALILGTLCLIPALASSTDPTPTAAALPSVGPSLIRLLGAFALVLGSGFILLWFLRRGVRFGNGSRGTQRRLNVLEVRMLGNRQSLFVVGYDQQRLLLGSTPTGIQFLANLPAASEEAPQQLTPAPTPSLMPSFGEALQHALGRKA